MSISNVNPQPRDIVIYQRDDTNSYWGEAHISGSNLIFYIDSQGHINADNSASFYSLFPPSSVVGVTGTTLVTGGLYQITSSWALSASWAPSTNTGGSGTTLVTGGLYQITSSWALKAVNAGTTLVTGGLYQITSSWATNAVNAGTTLVTGGLYPITTSWAVNAINGGTQLVTGSLYPITASWSQTSSWALNVINAIFSLFSNSASFASSSISSSIINILSTSSNANFYVPFVITNSFQTIYIDPSGIVYNPGTDTLIVNNISASSVTASLLGTSSFAVTSSFTNSSSWAINAQTTSYTVLAQTAVSADFAILAANSINSQTASLSTFALTASNLFGAASVYGTVSSSFSPSQSLITGSCIGWYKFDNLTPFCDYWGQIPIVSPGELVRCWPDSTGNIGRNVNSCSAAGGMFKISYHVRGGPSGSVPFVHSDKSSVTPWATNSVGTFAVPIYVMAAFRSNNQDTICDGIGASNRILCQGGAGGWQLFAGSSFSAPGTASHFDQWLVGTWKSNGASSVIRANGATIASGNSGGQSINGFTLFSDYLGNQTFGGVSLAEIIFLQNINDTDMANVENYLMAKYKLGRYAGT